MRVFVVDDDPLLRIGLRIALDQKQGIEVVGEAGDGLSAIRKIRTYSPDISLVDVNMPILSGIKAIRTLRQAVPQMKIIVFSSYRAQHTVQDAIAAGADCYVLKNVDTDELVRIMKAVHVGIQVQSPYLLNAS